MDEQVRHLALELCLSNRKCNQTLDFDCLEMSSNPSFPCFNSMCFASLLFPKNELLQSEHWRYSLALTWTDLMCFCKILLSAKLEPHISHA